MSQSVPSTSNVSSSRSVQVTSVEVDPVVRMMEQLIKQQDVMIKLMKEIAHGAKQRKEDPIRTATPAPENEQLLDPEIRTRKLRLYRAALNGDWQVAKRIYELHNDDIRHGISKGGDTALHIAAGAKRIDFLKELVNMLNKEDLAQKNRGGITALSLAAASGMVKLARVVMNKNEGIAMVRDESELLPIHTAAALGHKDMVEYLYQETKDELNEKDRIELLVTLINTDLYDVALNLLKDHPDLATARAKNHETALHALSRKDLLFSNFSNQNPGFFWRCFKLGAKDVEDKKLQALQLVERLWEKAILLSDSKISELITSPRPLLFDAAKQGNVQFLSILIREYPDLLRKVDENYYSIFHIAVLNRREDIFKLIYEIGSAKDFIVMFKDKGKNNILHLAGMLAPSNRLNIVSGAALQMQRELLWFQEVSKVVQPRYAEAENKDGFTPRALFTKNHEGLREKGEKLMKDTATACMVAATLIATMVFAAAFTVPGGNKGDTGIPFFVQKVSFKIFAISDAISLVSSSASILTFLSILTSRYAEEDFLQLLPRKLLIGLATLFVSISAMMVVFSATFFIVFNEGRLWIAILITVIASMPVILFIGHHLQLFHDVVLSTYASNSLFQKGKSRLFYKQGEASEPQWTKEFNAHLPIPCTFSTNV